MVNDLIQYKDTFSVQDSTKIQDYETCPRLYFFRYVLGFRPDYPIHDLEFGIAWHLAKEVLYTDGYSEESVKKGMIKFEEYYRQFYPEIGDMDHFPKSPGNAELALMQHCIEFQNDNFEVLHTEVGATFLLSKGRIMYGKLDTIIRDLNMPKQQIKSIDSKTQGAHWSYLEDSYLQKFQSLAYTYFLYSYFEPSEVYGLVIESTIFKKTENELLRIPIQVNIDRLESWLWEAETIFDNIERDFDRLSSCKESDVIMKSFPRRTESCVKYNKICPLFQVCHAKNNPLQNINLIPAGFKIEHWDPRTQPTNVKLEVTL